jgi:FtsP/CotA-like multicopper oxidase with cupredoxin domain
VVDDFYRSRAYELCRLHYGGDAALRKTFDPAPELAPNPLREPASGAERHRIVLGGGMMGAMPSQREHRGTFWTVNGKLLRHDHRRAPEPLLSLKLGASYVLEFVNETSWHHPMHLHGHVFRVMTKDGKALARQPWADTVLLDPDSRAEIAFVADNPGDWMLHCHVLEHQASGMSAVIRVS